MISYIVVARLSHWRFSTGRDNLDAL